MKMLLQSKVSLLAEGLAATIGCVALLGQLGAQPAQSDQSKPEPLPRSIVSTHDLMHLFNQPLYKELKAAMAQEPTGEEGWKMIAARGNQAAEIANLVALRSQREQWHQMSDDLQQAGIALVKAAESKDFARTRHEYEALIDRCNACHENQAPNKAPQLTP